jgi:hypothetical protein
MQVLKNPPAPAAGINSRPHNYSIVKLLLAMLLLALAGATAYGLVWYRRFYHHVTPQELSHEVRHSTFAAAIRGKQVTLQLYQQDNAKDQQLVFFTSGDGGWSPFCADVAAHIAATGKTVVGFDAKNYLVTFASSQKPISPDDLAQDYDVITKTSAVQPGIRNSARIMLAGWSLGAGYSVLAASNPALRDRVDRVVAISLPTYNELAWKPTDALIYVTHGVPHEKVFDSRNVLPRLGPTPVVMVNSTDDDTSPAREAQSLFDVASGPKHLYMVKSSGHHFEGGLPEFYRDLDEGFAFIHP